MSRQNGFTDEVRGVLEQHPGRRFDVSMLMEELNLENKQPLYNALHELTKSGEIHRLKKDKGLGSWHWLDNDNPPELSTVLTPPADQSQTPGEQLQNLLRAPRTPSKAQQIHPEQAPALARQVGGDHYKSLKIQPIEFITANNIGFCEGCAIKYLVRWRQKNGIEDLKKARHYIDLLIEHEESAT